MIKIYFYELKRLVFSRLFAGLLAICLYVAWQILSIQTIQGVSNTAPFSPWSFGTYMSGALPVLCFSMPALLWSFFSAKARRFYALTDAAPVKQGTYLLIKCAAAVSAWLIIAISVSVLGIVFLLRLFGSAVPVAQLLLSGFFALIPAFVFVLGLGVLLGRIHALMLFLPLLPLAVERLLPASVQRFGAGFFSAYPLKLGGTDPAFSMPNSFLIGKLFCMFLGLAFLFLAVRKETHKTQASARIK